MLRYYKLTGEQNLERADLPNPRELNKIIWFSVRGDKSPMPAGLIAEDEEREEQLEKSEEREITARRIFGGNFCPI